MKEGPITKEEEKFALWYIKYRNIYKAADRAGIPKNKAKATFDRLEVQEEIERQENAVMVERAKIQASAENLNNDLLDRELLKLITLDEHTHGSIKQRAIELGLVLTGRIQMGNTKTMDLSLSVSEDAPLPTVYQAFIPVGVPVSVSPIIPEPSALQSAIRAQTSPQPALSDSPADTNSAPPKTGRLVIG